MSKSLCVSAVRPRVDRSSASQACAPAGQGPMIPGLQGRLTGVGCGALCARALDAQARVVLERMPEGEERRPWASQENGGLSSKSKWSTGNL